MDAGSWYQNPRWAIRPLWAFEGAIKWYIEGVFSWFRTHESFNTSLAYESRGDHSEENISELYSKPTSELLHQREPLCRPVSICGIWEWVSVCGIKPHVTMFWTAVHRLESFLTRGGSNLPAFEWLSTCRTYSTSNQNRRFAWGFILTEGRWNPLFDPVGILTAKNLDYRQKQDQIGDMTYILGSDNLSDFPSTIALWFVLGNGPLNLGLWSGKSGMKRLTSNIVEPNFLVNRRFVSFSSPRMNRILDVWSKMPGLYPN